MARARTCPSQPGRFLAWETLPVRSSTSPGEPTPTPARALGLELGRLRRLPHRLRHLLGDVLGATAGGRRPACLAEHLPPAVDDDGLDLGATEVDAAPGDHALMLLAASGPDSGGSGRWWSCRGRARARRRPAARGRSAWPATLPSSTPHWSKESMPQIAPWVKTLCSYSATSDPRVCGVEPLGEDRVGRAGCPRRRGAGRARRACPPRAPARRSCRTPAPRSERRRWPSAGRGARRAG